MFQRVIVIGMSGSGKSTFAAELARVLGCTHVELDALFWKPGWKEADQSEFLALVEAATAPSQWVVCGNYWNRLRTLLWDRADTVVWLDLPMRVTQRRVVLRTIRRALTREHLWGTNRERLSNLWSADALWRFNRARRDEFTHRYEQAMTDPRWSHLSFHRLRSGREVRRLMAALPELLGH